MVKIQEIIPLTVQGEGRWTGMPCSFVRLFGCLVGCYFCDTGYANGNKPSYQEMNLEDILPQLKSPNVVISGGEPTVNPRFSELLDLLINDERQVYVETAGIKWLDRLKDAWVTFSPKVTVSKLYPDYRFWELANEIKIVISCPADFEYYLPVIEGRENVSLQPEWGREKDILPFIIEKANHFNFRVSIQTHKHLGVR